MSLDREIYFKDKKPKYYRRGHGYLEELDRRMTEEEQAKEGVTEHEIYYVSDLHADDNVYSLMHELNIREGLVEIEELEKAFKELLRIYEGHIVGGLFTNSELQKVLDGGELDKKEMLLIGGDITHNPHMTYYLLARLSIYFKTIVVVFGNHDYYRLGGKPSSKVNEETLKNLILVGNAEGLDIRFLEKESTEVNGVTISGANMWYQILKKDEEHFNNISNDSVYLDGIDINEEYRESRKWYNSLPQREIDIILTHVPLSSGSTNFEDERFYLNEINNKKRAIHIYGHTHGRMDRTNRDEDGEVTSVELMNCYGFKFKEEMTGKGVLLRDPVIKNFYYYK